MKTVNEIRINASAAGLFVNDQEVEGYRTAKDQYGRTVCITAKTRNASKWLAQGQILAVDHERNEILVCRNGSASWNKLGPSLEILVKEEAEETEE